MIFALSSVRILSPGIDLLVLVCRSRLKVEPLGAQMEHKRGIRFCALRVFKPDYAKPCSRLGFTLVLKAAEPFFINIMTPGFTPVRSSGSSMV